MEIIRVGDEIKAECYGTGYVTRVCNNTCAVTWQNGSNGVMNINSVLRTGYHDAHIEKLFYEGQLQVFTPDEAIEVLQSVCIDNERMSAAMDYAVEFMKKFKDTNIYSEWEFTDTANEHGKCKRCGYGPVDLCDGGPHDYCPRCGANMRRKG